MQHHHLELLGTSACHLCEEAELLIGQHIDLVKWHVDVVDISKNDDLMNTYALRIPVLLHPLSNKTLDWPFNQRQLLHFIGQSTNSRP